MDAADVNNKETLEQIRQLLVQIAHSVGLGNPEFEVTLEMVQVFRLGSTNRYDLIERLKDLFEQDCNTTNKSDYEAAMSALGITSDKAELEKRRIEFLEERYGRSWDASDMELLAPAEGRGFKAIAGTLLCTNFIRTNIALRRLAESS